MDLRRVYFSVAALTGHVDVNSLLHFAFTVSSAVSDDAKNTKSCCFFFSHVFVFQVFDTESKGSLSEKELTALMGALLGVPQDSTEELYRTAADGGELTEGEKGFLFWRAAGKMVNQLSTTQFVSSFWRFESSDTFELLSCD